MTNIWPAHSHFFIDLTKPVDSMVPPSSPAPVEPVEDIEDSEQEDVQEEWEEDWEEDDSGHERYEKQEEREYEAEANLWKCGGCAWGSDSEVECTQPKVEANLWKCGGCAWDSDSEVECECTQPKVEELVERECSPQMEDQKEEEECRGPQERHFDVYLGGISGKDSPSKYQVLLQRFEHAGCQIICESDDTLRVSTTWNTPVLFEMVRQFLKECNYQRECLKGVEVKLVQRFDLETLV